MTLLLRLGDSIICNADELKILAHIGLKACSLLGRSRIPVAAVEEEESQLQHQLQGVAEAAATTRC
jgi:hypothetical protein